MIFGGFPRISRGLACAREVWENAPMTSTQPPPHRRKGPKLTSVEAQARLADALRENLRRRKMQSRAKEHAIDEKSGGTEGNEDG